MGKKLTPKQERFCREYMIDLNATQAAIRAGYSEKTASEQGYENLRKPQIANKIAELQEEKAEKLNISFEDCLRRAWEIATSEEKDRARGLELSIKMQGYFDAHNKQKKPDKVKRRAIWKRGKDSVEMIDE